MLWSVHDAGMLFRWPRKARRRIAVDWHDWFAWRPVRVSADYVAWLEVVRRARFKWSGGWIYMVREERASDLDPPF